MEAAPELDVARDASPPHEGLIEPPAVASEPAARFGEGIPDPSTVGEPIPAPVPAATESEAKQPEAPKKVTQPRESLDREFGPLDRS